MRRSRAQRPIDIWPGFVDALASLLLVIIFLLMVFVLGQFVLNEAISGRDEQLGKLSRELTELGRVLALERGTNDDLRATVGRLQAELQTATTARDDLSRRLAQVQGQAEESAAAVEALRGDVARSTEAATASGRRADELNAQIQVLASQLAALQRARDELEAELTRTREAVQAARQAAGAETERATGLAGELSRAQEANRAAADRAAADRATIDRQTADLARAQQQAATDRTTIERQAGELARAAERATADRATIDRQTADLNTARESLRTAGERAAADRATLDKQAADLARALEAIRAAGVREDATKATIQQQLAEIGRLKGLSDTLEETRKRLEAQIEAERARLAESGRSLASQQDQTRAARADVERVAQDVAALREQLSRVSRALELSEARGVDKDARINDLGTRLNAAMLNRVEELERYRSEFFGKLRAAIGERTDVRIVGDRFVLPSEVLFASGQAVLQPAGRDAIARIASSLKDIASTIPKEIPWVVRVDGHTDTVPIANERFPSNWELSTARAVSVVRFLVEQGIPASRLVAAGFGEFQPIDPENTDLARSRNRRIEFKLTER